MAQAPATGGSAGRDSDGRARTTGLIVGSGNFFSPIVADLDKALTFYRDGLGFETTGAPGEATGTAPLMSMFGLPPEAKLRYQNRAAARVAHGCRDRGGFGRRR